MATDPDTPLFDAIWTVVATEGWRGLSAPRLATASGVPEAELLSRFRCRTDLLGFLTAHVDEAVVAGTVPDPAASPRDRIFDLLMRRLDVLQPHRAGVLALVNQVRRDPVLGAAMLSPLRRSMSRMLDAAALDSSGPAGSLRAIGLAGVWLQTLRAWAGDETLDLTQSMAALDRALERAEQVARSLGLPPGDMLPPGAASADGAPPEPTLN